MPAALSETSTRVPPRLRRSGHGPRKRVQTLNDERDLADVAHDLGTQLTTLARPVLFRRGRIPVFPDLIPQADGTSRIGLIPLTPAKARTFFSDWIEFYRTKHDAQGRAREITVTLSKSEAEGLLEAEQLLHALPEIVTIHARPLPVLRADGTLHMLAPGYDTDFRIYTYPA